MGLAMSVIGTGYLGAVHAACMALEGHDVVGVDTDEARAVALARGEAPFYEPGLDEALVAARGTGRLRFTSDIRAAGDCTVHFLCVGTPQSRDGLAADTTYLMAAAHALAPHVRGDALVVGKSTVPVGTSGAVELAMSGERGGGVRVAWNPEFLREGFAIRDTLHPDRLVYGVDAASASADVAVLDEVYAGQVGRGVQRLVVDRTTAELVKVAANSFLATKISFINAMAQVCEAAGGDVVALADAIGMDPRIGRSFLNAGLGFGGGCLPKDIRAFLARAEELGVGEALDFLRAVDRVNLGRRTRVVELATSVCGGSLEGARVAVLGAAFKPDSDDIRDSPALDVAQRLHRLGASVTIHDPKATHRAKAVAPELNYSDSALGACTDADVVLHLTEWPEYRALDPADLARVVRAAVVVDGRNVLDAARWRAAGWTCLSLGRPAA